MNARYGAYVAAGLGRARVLAEIDFETYSEAGYFWNETRQAWDGPPNAPLNKKGLPVIGVANYAKHPSTEVLSAAYDLKDGQGPRVWMPGMPPPVDLFLHLAKGGLIEAHNAAFEKWVWNEVCTRRYMWPPLNPEQVRCSAAKARAFSLPGKLADAGAVLNLEIQKDPDGERLIKLFCMPQKPSKAQPEKRISFADRPADADRMIQYNLRDIAAEAALSQSVPDLEGDELENWLLDQRINARGVGVDLQGIHDCIAIIEQAHTKYNQELHQLTGGGVESASQTARLLGWLAALGVPMQNMDDEAVQRELGRSDLPPQARRALEIRALIGSAAVKKAFAMRNRATGEGRLHDLYIFHGARTGRTTGDGVQPTNFPNSGPEVCTCPRCGQIHTPRRPTCPRCGALEAREVSEWDERAVEQALRIIGTEDLATVESYFGDAMAAVSGCLRGLFQAKPGHDFLCSDYSAIEAVALAMLAGEQWRIDLFRTHGKIYEMSAAKISGVPFDEFMKAAGYTAEELAAPDWYKRKPATPTGKHHPLRKSIGKIAELASGYQGWVGAWKAFGADEFMSEDEIKNAILAWRRASPDIVAFWGGQKKEVAPYTKVDCLHGVEGMFVAAILSPGQVFEFRGHKFQVRGDALYLTLLSGRHLVYHRPRLQDGGRDGYTISYEGANTNPNNGPVGFIRMQTWGGRLTENIVQATCRDIQWYGMRNLERAGYPIVLHVYDEDCAEVPKGFGSVAEFEKIMSTMPPWASDWPIRASGGWRRERYGK